MKAILRFGSTCLILMSACLILGCAALRPVLDEPNIQVTSIELLPARGLQQRIALGLIISNPNAQDLSVIGISYSIGIENFSVLSGVSDQLPLLKAYQDTPVMLEVSANLLELVRLLEYLSRQKDYTDMTYHFNAKLDFNAWLPTMHVNKTGQLPLLK